MSRHDWVLFCKRTNDPKLAYIEWLLDNAGIPSRRKGESWHAPILQVQEKDLDKAWDILGPIDEIDDDDPKFADGIQLRDKDREENYEDEMEYWRRAGLNHRGQP